MDVLSKKLKVSQGRFVIPRPHASLLRSCFGTRVSTQATCLDSSSQRSGLSKLSKSSSKTRASQSARTAGRVRQVVSAVFERFTERSIKSVVIAQNEAKNMGSPEVRTKGEEGEEVAPAQSALVW